MTPAVVRCSHCGRPLEIQDRWMEGSGAVCCSVIPCVHCVSQAYDAAKFAEKCHYRMLLTTRSKRDIAAYVEPKPIEKG